MRKYLSLILLLSSPYSFGDDISGLTTEQELGLLAEGLPVPGTGVTIVPRQEMKLSSEEINQFSHLKAEKEKQGYLKEYNARAKELLELTLTIPQHYKKQDRSDFYSTDIKKTIDEIPMAYPFTAVPQREVKHLLGFAPMGTYIQNMGWTGAGEFFNPSMDSTCAFSESNLSLTHGAAILPKEDVTYIINEKVTLHNVIGNEQSGYLYEIEWYDKKFRRKLECATKKYTKEMNQSVVNLAKLIDSAD